MSQVEKPGVFIVQSSFLPVLALKIVLDLKVCVSLSADNKENILKIFGQDLLILSALEKCVEIVDLLLLLLACLGAQEAHVMHNAYQVIELKNVVLWVGPGSSVQGIVLWKLLSEFFSESLDDHRVTLSVLEQGVVLSHIRLSLLVSHFLLLVLNLLMELVQGQTGVCSTVAFSDWAVASLWNLDSHGVHLRLLVFELFIDQFLSLFLSSVFVKSLRSWNLVSVFHQLNNLLGDRVDVRLS